MEIIKPKISDFGNCKDFYDPRFNVDSEGLFFLFLGVDLPVGAVMRICPRVPSSKIADSQLTALQTHVQQEGAVLIQNGKSNLSLGTTNNRIIIQALSIFYILFLCNEGLGRDVRFVPPLIPKMK